MTAQPVGAKEKHKAFRLKQLQGAKERLDSLGVSAASEDCPISKCKENQKASRLKQMQGAKGSIIHAISNARYGPINISDILSPLLLTRANVEQTFLAIPVDPGHSIAHADSELIPGLLVCRLRVSKPRAQLAPDWFNRGQVL